MASGRYETTEVLRRVTALGLRSKTGKPLAKQTLRNYFVNPLYAGWVVVDEWGARHRGDFEPIVSDELFQRVQDALAGRRHHGRVRQRVHPDFSLRQFVSCASCSSGMTASWSKGRSRRYGCYRCPRCKGVNVRREELERQFLELLVALRPKQEFTRLFRAVVLDVVKNRQAKAARVRAALQRRVDELRARRSWLIERQYRGRLSEDAFQDESSRLEKDWLSPASS